MNSKRVSKKINKILTVHMVCCKGIECGDGPVLTLDLQSELPVFFPDCTTF